MITPNECRSGANHGAGAMVRCAALAAAVCGRLAPFALAMLVGGCAMTMHGKDLPEKTRSSHPPYVLGPGDELRVTVYQHEDLSGTFVVDDTGSISLPLIQRIELKGLTLRDVEQNITTELLGHHIADPRVSVDLIELRPLCVIGEVRRPGCFNYAYGMTASEAIAMAGGYSYRARENEFVITDENGEKLRGNHDTPVFRGDVIEIRERFF